MEHTEAADWVPLQSVLQALPPPAPTVSQEVLERYVRTNCARGLPQVPIVPGHKRRAAICAGGPSLARSLGTIRRLDSWILAVNKASNYLLNSGIVPHYIALSAPEPDLLTGNQFAIDPRCSYLLSSAVDPAVFDALASCQRFVWHASDVEPWTSIIAPHYPVQRPYAVSGTTVTLRAVDLLYLMGYRWIDIYGFDGSFEGDGAQHHAYEQVEDDNDPRGVITVECDGRAFFTRGDYAREATELHKTLETYNMLWRGGRADMLRIRVHGDGLIPHYWRAIRRNYA